MTPEEIESRTADLKAREEEPAAREAEFARDIAAKGKKPIEPTSPPPSSYAASIKTYVPITLDLQDSNYAKWRELFLVALDRYGLTAHVLGDGDATPSDTLPTSEWARDDYTVLSWIYGSISIELFGIIMVPGSSAKQIWNAIDVEFCNTPEGDMTISNYCAKLKSLADALTDVGQAITDETLVLTMPRGLNEQ